MPSLAVALFQTNIQWLDRQANLADLDSKIADLPNVDLIVLPETFATGFAFDQAGVGEPDKGEVYQWMVQTAEKTQAVVVGSVAVNCQDKNANRMYWVWPDGTTRHYDKRHLFRMGNEHEHVVAGEVREVFEVNGFRLLPLVCYDLRFPVWSRNRNDYDVLVNVANWPGARRKVWDTLLQARAMENQCFVLGVNRVGDDGKGTGHSGGTAVYDFKGDTLAATKDDEPEVLLYTLTLDDLNQFKQNFPAYLDGDDFELKQ